MARHVTSAGSDFLGVAAAPLTGVPLTLSCWFNPDNVTGNHTLLGLFDDTSQADAFYISASGASTNDPLHAITVAANNFSFSLVNGFVAGSWQHAGGVFGATTSRIAYLNGVAGTPETTLRTPVGVDNTWIGKFQGTSTVYSDVSVAEAAVWDVALTAAEMAILAKGYSPLFVRPESLVGYWPLIGRLSPETSVVDSTYNLALNGSGITTVAHPRIIYPSRPWARAIAPAAVGGSASLRVRGSRMRMGVGT